MRLLLIVADLIVIPLCKFVNVSFFTGVFSDAFKIAKIIPLHKGGSTQEIKETIKLTYIVAYS